MPRTTRSAISKPSARPSASAVGEAVSKGSNGDHGREVARAFSQAEQRIDAYDGASVLSDDIEENLAKLRAEVARWKREMSIEDYAAALEAVLEEHTIGYVINSCVRSSFLAWGPSFN